MRALLLMFMAVLVLPLVLLLVACEPTVYDLSHYKNDPAKKKVNVDGAVIYVVPEIGGYAAWGGEQYRDGKFIKYRQRRAIEIVSHCHIDKVLSNPSDNMTFATVNC